MQNEADLIDPDGVAGTQALFPQDTFRALSESDRRRIRVVVNLDGETTVELPEDLDTSRVRSMARFAEIYLGGYLKALLSTWGGPDDG